MLWNVFVVLLFLWLSGFVSGYTMGGFIHYLMVLAIIVLGVDIFREEGYGRNLESSQKK